MLKVLCALLKQTNILQDDTFEERRDDSDDNDNGKLDSHALVKRIEGQLKQKNRKSQQAKDNDAIENKELCQVSHMYILVYCPGQGGI